MSQVLPERPGGAADDHDAVGDVTRHHGTGTDEGTGTDRAPLQDDGTRPDRAPGLQADAPADAGAGQDGDDVAEHAVVPDGRAVLDVDVIADDDVAADVRQRHDDAAAAEDRLGSADGRRVDEGAGDESTGRQHGREPRAHTGVGDADRVGGVHGGVGRRADGQPAYAPLHRTLVDEGRHRHPARDRHVQHLTAGAAGADDVEVHGPHPAAPTATDLLLVALVALVALCTASAGGRPGPQLALLAVAVLVHAVARLVAATPHGLVAGTASIALGTVAWVVTTPDGLSGAALAGPLGYGNANGALCTVGAGAAAVLALAARERAVRAGALVLAATATALAVQTGSAAAAGLSAALLALAVLLLVRPAWSRLVPLLSAAAVIGTALLTVGLAVGAPGTATTAAGEALSARRIVLWAEAVDLVRADPLTGTGLGGFATTAPTAVADTDARAAHSAWLQQAAETGLVGGSVLLCTAAAAVSLRRRRPTAAMGGAAGAAVLVQAGIDYVLHFPAVVLLTVAVCALTVIPRRTPV